VVSAAVGEDTEEPNISTTQINHLTQTSRIWENKQGWFDTYFKYITTWLW